MIRKDGSEICLNKHWYIVIGWNINVSYYCVHLFAATCMSMYPEQCRPLVVCSVLSVSVPYTVQSTGCLQSPVCQCTLCNADHWLSAIFYLSMHPIQMRLLVICNVLSVNVPCKVQTTCLRCHVCQYTIYSADHWLSALYRRSMYPA